MSNTVKSVFQSTVNSTVTTIGTTLARPIATTPLAIAAGISLVSFFQPAAAETAWQDEPLVVTANRTEQSAITVPARISVITRAEIERSQAPDLVELLRLEAGIDLARNGGPGGQTSVFMRGSNSNHVLVLIDGVRAAASGTGAFTWEILDPSVIERIEIVRGPRAARWGSDAIGGVIQIFTRRPEGVSASVRYGSDDDRKATLAAGRQQGTLPLDLTLTARSVDGFSAQNPRGFGFNPDDDGFENLSAAIGGAADLAGGALSWRGRAASGETEFDQGVSDFDNWSWRFDYAAASNGPWQWRLGAATLRDRLETETAFGRSEVITRRIQGDILAERRLGGATWLVGLDAWRESGVSRGQWNESRTNVGVFTGLEGGAGNAGYELSVRLDDDEEFGSELTGSAGLNWRIGERWRVFTSAGRAFRAPNFSQLYSPGFFGGLFAGNPDLDPERSWSAEAGLDFSPTRGQRLTLSAYTNWIDDLIAFSGADFQAINVRRARIRGLEFTHSVVVPGGWSSRFNLTLQDPADRDAGGDLLRRAGFKGNWVLGYAAGNRWNIDGELAHVGDRLDVGGVRLASYTLINLRAAYRLRDHWHLEFRVDNLADRKYEPLFGFNAADRRMFVRLGWSS